MVVMVTTTPLSTRGARDLCEDVSMDGTGESAPHCVVLLLSLWTPFGPSMRLSYLSDMISNSTHFANEKKKKKRIHVRAE